MTLKVGLVISTQRISWMFLDFHQAPPRFWWYIHIKSCRAMEGGASWQALLFVPMPPLGCRLCSYLSMSEPLLCLPQCDRNSIARKQFTIVRGSWSAVLQVLHSVGAVELVLSSLSQYAPAVQRSARGISRSITLIGKILSRTVNEGKGVIRDRSKRDLDAGQVAYFNKFAFHPWASCDFWLSDCRISARCAGSTLVMRAITLDNALAVRKAVSVTARGERASQLLNEPWRFWSTFWICVESGGLDLAWANKCLAILQFLARPDTKVSWMTGRGCDAPASEVGTFFFGLLCFDWFFF